MIASLRLTDVCAFREWEREEQRKGDEERG